MYKSRRVAQLFVHFMIYIYIYCQEFWWIFPYFVCFKEIFRRNDYILADFRWIPMNSHVFLPFPQVFVQNFRNLARYSIIPEEIGVISLERWRWKQKSASWECCPHNSAAAPRVFLFPEMGVPPFCIIYKLTIIMLYFDFSSKICYNIYRKRDKNNSFSRKFIRRLTQMKEKSMFERYLLAM